MSWQTAVAEALIQVTAKKVIAVAAANAAVMLANKPAKVTRYVDGNPQATDDAIKLTSLVIFQYVYMQEIVAFALATLKEKSPVGGAGDTHPGLYRDSHMVFLDGKKVDDVSSWQPGQTIHNSNPVPYARRIEVGGFTMNVPGHVYEDTAQILAGKYSNTASIKFIYMPVSFGSIADYAQSTAGQASATRRGGSPKALRDWLTRQPAIQITALS